MLPLEIPKMAYEELMQNASTWPKNLRWPAIQAHYVTTVKQQLVAREHRLFKSGVDVADLRVIQVYRLGPGEDFHDVPISDEQKLDEILRLPLVNCRTDPKCRYVYISQLPLARRIRTWLIPIPSFIHSKTSRSALDLTMPMFLRLMTYHRIMPVFVEYILPFGAQAYKRNQYGAGFHSDSSLHKDTYAVDERLGRSGRHLEFCYTLQAPEMINTSVLDSSGPRPRDWSVRMCSVWHDFDLEYERQAWVIIKANNVIEKILRDGTRNYANSNVSPHSTSNSGLCAALRSSMQAHQDIATWSLRNWHMYLNSLENQLQEMTRPLLTVDMDEKHTPYQFPQNDLSGPPKMWEWTDPQSKDKPKFSHRARLSFRHSTKTHDLDVEKQAQVLIEPEIHVNPETTFSNLQSLQNLQEKGEEMGMIMNSNKQVLRQITQEYRSVVGIENPESQNLADCQLDFSRFESKLCSIETSFTVLQSRATAFSSLLQQRKELAHEILQWKHTKANLDAAHNAQKSAMKMEGLSEEMRQIAIKTQGDTVSMRIITVVTLIFLPLTYISTLMSTDMIKFDPGAPNISDRISSRGAIRFYFAVSGPLTVFTIVIWIAFRHWDKIAELQRNVFSRSPRKE